MGRRTVVLFILVLVVLGIHLGCSRPPEGSPDWYFNQAYDLANQGLHEEAVEEYTKVIDGNPTNSIEIQTYINRAAAYASLKHWEEAISDSTKAIELDPERTLAYMNRAMAYNAIEEYDLAIADCNMALDIDPEQTFAYFYRGLAHGGLGLIEEAIGDFEDFVRLTDSPAWVERASQEIQSLLEQESVTEETD